MKHVHVLKNIKLDDGIDLVISRPLPDKAKKIVDFLNEVGGETDFLTYGLGEFPFSVEEEKIIISECIESDFCLMIIAEIENEIASQLFLQRSNRSRLAHIGDIGITVSKKYWGNSIGKHMILTAIEWARQKGIAKLQLQVRSDNDRAIGLYKRLGFNIEGLIGRAIKLNGNYFDDYIMGLVLD